MHDVVRELDIPTKNELERSLMSPHLESSKLFMDIQSSKERKFRNQERSYITSPYEHVPVTLESRFEAQPEVVMKVTVFKQVKRAKESEYLCFGSVKLIDLVPYIEQSCIEVEACKDQSKPFFFLIEDSVYCRKMS